MPYVRLDAVLTFLAAIVDEPKAVAPPPVIMPMPAPEPEPEPDPEPSGREILRRRLATKHVESA